MPTATATQPLHHHHRPKQPLPPIGSPSRSGIIVPTQLSNLANEARSKLYHGVLHADDYDLRVLVGHANFLDCLMKELLAREPEAAAREEEDASEGLSLLLPPPLPPSSLDKQTVKAQDFHLAKKTESHHAPAISVTVRKIPTAEADAPSLCSLPELRPVPSPARPWR